MSDLDNLPRFKPEWAHIHAEWVARLRSPHMKATGRLRDINTGGFCCVGVLCDVLTDHGFGSWDSEGRWHHASSHARCTHVLYGVTTELFDSDDPDLDPLYGRNDGSPVLGIRPMSRPQLARIVEARMKPETT